jgi:hypothetical protein
MIFLCPGTVFLVQSRGGANLGWRMSRNDPETRGPSKKTESLEIRLSPEEKSDFLAACRRAGETASAVLRNAMRAYVREDSEARVPRRLAMITLPLAAAAFGALALFNTAQTALADAIVSDVEISVRQARPPANGEPAARSSQRMKTTLELAEGRRTRFFFDDDGPLYFGPHFNAGAGEDGQSVQVEITASRTEAVGQVLYDLTVTLVNGEGRTMGEAINPRLLSQAGETVRMSLGLDGPGELDDWLEISLTPQPVPGTAAE